ncbi:MAG TPA: hypothetical protein VF161_09310 [Steroidobacteraceae bacterium]
MADAHRFEESPDMNSIRSFTLLRGALLADAVSSGAMGLALLAFAPALERLLQLPAGLLREAGVVLLTFAAFVGFLASRAQPPRGAVWTVIAINAIWVIDSVLMLFTGWVEPNALGIGFVLAQAGAVAVFADLQYLGLRKSRSLATG